MSLSCIYDTHEVSLTKNKLDLLEVPTNIN